MTKYELWTFGTFLLFPLLNSVPRNPSAVSVDSAILSRCFDTSYRHHRCRHSQRTSSKRVQNANACSVQEFTGKFFAGKLLNWVGICCAMHFVLFAFFQPRIFHTSHLPRKYGANSWKLVTPWDAFSPSIQRSDVSRDGNYGLLGNRS